MRAQIRPFTESDFSRVCVLEQGQGERGCVYPAAVFIRQASVLYPGTFFVAHCHGEVTGYGIGGVLGDAPGKAWILRLRVSPSYLRNHIGTDLLEALIRECARRKVSVLQLSVAPENTAALALYRKTGFTATGFFRGYFGEAEDRIIMTMEIPAFPPGPPFG